MAQSENTEALRRSSRLTTQHNYADLNEMGLTNPTNALPVIKESHSEQDQLLDSRGGGP